MGKFKASVETAIHTGKVFFMKHGPKILFWGGIGCVVGGTILACNATLKLPEIIEERDKQIDDIKQRQIADTTGTTEIDIPTEKATNREITIVHGKTALAIGKEYLPAVVVSGIGIGMLTKSNSILTKRYLALSAAYASLQTEFMAYREGVRKRFGDAVDHELIFGVEQKTLTFTNKDTGETEEKEQDVVALSKYGKLSMDMTVYYDERSQHYENNPAFNRRMVDLVFYNANEKLRARGEAAHDNLRPVLFANEINDALDLPRTKAGWIFGWRYDPDNPYKISYDILSGGIPEDGDCLVVDERDPRLLIRYNVDGNVLEELD